MTDERAIIREQLEGFFDALKWAAQCGVHYEFMEFFLRDYGNNKEITAAIDYANREWDL